VIEWAGWRGTFAIWGDQRPLSEIWWHFPIVAAFVFLSVLFWPFRLAGE